MNGKTTKPTSARSDYGTDWAALDALTDEDIERAIAEDPTAARPLTREWFEGAERVRPGRKRPISIRFDEEVLQFFQAGGAGYQSRINAVLVWYVRWRKRLGVFRRTNTRSTRKNAAE
jgi:uncharacterized protein (DUF4415 family)